MEVLGCCVQCCEQSEFAAVYPDHTNLEPLPQCLHPFPVGVAVVETWSQARWSIKLYRKYIAKCPKSPCVYIQCKGSISVTIMLIHFDVFYPSQPVAAAALLSVTAIKVCKCPLFVICWWQVQEWQCWVVKEKKKKIQQSDMFSGSHCVIFNTCSSSYSWFRIASYKQLINNIFKAGHPVFG